MSFVALSLLRLVTGAPPASAATPWRDALVFTISDRARVEAVDWFRPDSSVAPGDPEQYVFFGNQLRVGAKLTLPAVQLVLEIQDTRLSSLPNDATVAAPIGALGPGGTYFANTSSQNQGETVVKLGHATFRRSGLAVSGGGFEYADGLATIPSDRTLAWVKRTRIAERLIGPFGYTMVTRSFDGARIAYDRPTWNVTAIGVVPTRGGFEVSANRDLPDITVAGLALSSKATAERPLDARVFYLHYRDERDDAVKADNRTLAERQADDDPIDIHTIGSHVIAAAERGPGVLDGLLWSVVQAGEWGEQDHLAWACALEAGYQLSRVPWRPWLRAGYAESSGDDDPLDGDHNTFFQLLPTARAYAQLPFYNAMNSRAHFAQLLLHPRETLTLRIDYHHLNLNERDNLWYSGGGATNEQVFGFSGIPSGGSTDLAQLVDVSASVTLTTYLSVYAYYGHAFGDRAVKSSFAGSDANYGYVDMVFRW